MHYHNRKTVGSTCIKSCIIQYSSGTIILLVLSRNQFQMMLAFQFSLRFILPIYTAQSGREHGVVKTYRFWARKQRGNYAGKSRKSLEVGADSGAILPWLPAYATGACILLNELQGATILNQYWASQFSLFTSAYGSQCVIVN